MFTHEPEMYPATQHYSQMLLVLHCEFCLHSTIRYERENFNTPQEPKKETRPRTNLGLVFLSCSDRAQRDECCLVPGMLQYRKVLSYVRREPCHSRGCNRQGDRSWARTGPAFRLRTRRK